MNIHKFANLGDLKAIRDELAKGTSVDARDERGFTPLACAASSQTADESMLRLLIESGANVNAAVGESKEYPLGIAACSGSMRKVQLLAEAGANVRHTTESGYTVLINIMYKLFDDERLVPMIELLVKLGAETDCETGYGESPLSVSAHFGRFDAVSALLDAEADPSPLQWTKLMQAIALGTVDEVQTLLLEKDHRLDERDRWERTPWLLACVTGDIAKAKLILEAGADLKDRERMGSAALAITAEKGNVEMLSWLLDVGADIEAVDGASNTALMLAAQAGKTDCVRLLLEAGALSNRKNEYSDSTMSMASTEGVMRLLVGAGADISEISTELKRTLLGLQSVESLNVTKKEYKSGCRPRFGKSNPEVMDIPFWHEMVRAGISAYQAKDQFNDVKNMSQATWCYSRFGVSFTELPDGRFVQIGGEHEDFYDPDFCIYNDVLIHEQDGQFQIMGYPEKVFPPTDFHSATYLDGFIYVVGGLGYSGSRQFGTTPIYRLNCETWKIESVASTRDKPGWIYEHKACFDDSGLLVISGGKICLEVKGEEEHVDNENVFTLDLSSRVWTRA
ncbi:ankyrin repeat domain-containing protein [Neorhodopirellula pilleata]|uniref:Ankyrin repeats (3 copies) n=1 Tax=Neorhodopirellula pilleata TaxID=2714738 RepID=A0A5C5ZVM3_9BACT|nr:ankyrin repeat domain-containing protein [Neorhodopirellula pilleata]TWT91185.1 Ankyrin repeats (3 copies) [Neorhodopirellula pilleata]